MVVVVSVVFCTLSQSILLERNSLGDFKEIKESIIWKCLEGIEHLEVETRVGWIKHLYNRYDSAGQLHCIRKTPLNDMNQMRFL